MIPLSKIKRIVTSVMGKGISDIVPLKKGMTNDSYIFRHGDSRYVLRLNGVGTEKLINRKQESDTYRAIAGLSLSDTVIAIDEKQGYKITKFIENARTCNPMNTEDVSLCMEKLRAFHEKNIHTSYTFDLYRMLDYYQSLWIRKKSMYADYDEVKNRIYNWKPWIEKVNGDFNEEVIEEAKKCGYRLGLGIFYGVPLWKQNPLALPRIPIPARQPMWEFKLKVSSIHLLFVWLRQMERTVKKKVRKL